MSKQTSRPSAAAASRATPGVEPDDYGSNSDLLEAMAHEQLTADQVDLPPAVADLDPEQLGRLGLALDGVGRPANTPILDAVDQGAAQVGAEDVTLPGLAGTPSDGLASAVAGLDPKETDLRVSGGEYEVMAHLNPWIQVVKGKITDVDPGPWNKRMPSGWEFVRNDELTAAGVDASNPVGGSWGGGAAGATGAPAAAAASASAAPLPVPTLHRCDTQMAIAHLTGAGRAPLLAAAAAADASRMAAPPAALQAQFNTGTGMPDTTRPADQAMGMMGDDSGYKDQRDVVAGYDHHYRRGNKKPVHNRFAPIKIQHGAIPTGAYSHEPAALQHLRDESMLDEAELAELLVDASPAAAATSVAAAQPDPSQAARATQGIASRQSLLGLEVARGMVGGAGMGAMTMAGAHEARREAAPARFFGPAGATSLHPMAPVGIVSSGAADRAAAQPSQDMAVDNIVTSALEHRSGRTSPRGAAFAAALCNAAEALEDDDSVDMDELEDAFAKQYDPPV